MGWGEIYSAGGHEDESGREVWCDEDKGPDNGEEAVEVCRRSKSGPGFAGRRHEGLHIRLNLLPVGMLLLLLLWFFSCACSTACREGNGVVSQLNGGYFPIGLPPGWLNAIF